MSQLHASTCRFNIQRFKIFHKKSINSKVQRLGHYCLTEHIPSHNTDWQTFTVNYWQLCNRRLCVCQPVYPDEWNDFWPTLCFNKKQPLWFLVITSANKDRFTKSLPKETFYVAVMETSLSPQLCCYTTTLPYEI